MFRSETVGYYHLLIPNESAWEILNEIGNLSAIDFVDLND
jgi:hypothetical protein